MSNQFDVPILCVIFNRPEKTERLFAVIRTVRPHRLYIAADGPRTVDEHERCMQARHIFDAIDWPCQVYRRFSETNQGCKIGVSDAISWFFTHEQEGIILEDDCIPHPDFFVFCKELLAYYRDDRRVMMISGDNFQNGIHRGGNASYYFSAFCHIWGWATWRRAWNLYDRSMQEYPSFFKHKTIESLFPQRKTQAYWKKILDKVYYNQIDTWDYQWIYSIWRAGGLCAMPNVNLVSNIGWDSEATHTKKTSSSRANMATKTLGAIIHPATVARDTAADTYSAAQLQDQIPTNLLNDHFVTKSMNLLKKIWTASPQSISTYVRRHVLPHRTSTPTTITRIEGGQADGISLHLPANRKSYYQLMAHGVYEPYILNALTGETSVHGKIIWDVGAHIGYHTLLFAKSVGSTGKVIAFEPNPNNAQQLTDNKKINPELATRIQVRTEALSNESGSCTMRVSKDPYRTASSGGHLQDVTPPLDEDAYDAFQDIIISATTIDKLVSQEQVPPPDIIKIDIEGAEMLCLKGAEETLRMYRPIIILEIHSTLLMFLVQQFLLSLKYDLRVIDADSPGITKNILATPNF